MLLEYRLRNIALMKFDADLYLFVDGHQSNFLPWQAMCDNAVTFDENTNILHIATTVELDFVNDPDKKRFITVAGFAEFDLLNWEEYQKAEGPKIPQDFISVLLGIVYSTFRGVVMDRTSVVGGILLPLINPNDLFRNVVHIAKAENVNQ